MRFYRVSLLVSSKEYGGICETSNIVQADTPEKAVKIAKEVNDKYLKDAPDAYINDISEYVEVYEITPNNGVIFSDMNEFRNTKYDGNSEEDGFNVDYNGTVMIEEKKVVKRAFSIQ